MSNPVKCFGKIEIHSANIKRGVAIKSFQIVCVMEINWLTVELPERKLDWVM